MASPALYGADMVTDALIITCIGMGFVFIFLGILVLVMGLLSRIMPVLNRFIPEPVVPAKPKPAIAAQASDAAIAAAVALAWYNSGRSK
ncbi:MAG: OadG family protein [Elusimicrobiales bacterium]|nr:OadG family protein [Elusimicrobiales bacterium]